MGVAVYGNLTVLTVEGYGMNITSQLVNLANDLGAYHCSEREPGKFFCIATERLNNELVEWLAKQGIVVTAEIDI